MLCFVCFSAIKKNPYNSVVVVLVWGVTTTDAKPIGRGTTNSMPSSLPMSHTYTYSPNEANFIRRHRELTVML